MNEILNQACIGVNLLFSKISQELIITILESIDPHVNEPSQSDVTLYLTNTL